MLVGILGAGGMGNVHARHYRRMPDVELCFFDPHPQKATEYAAKYAATPCRSADDLIEKADAVDLCVPSDLHLEFGLRALAARKPLLVEKPLAKTVEECARLVDAADKAKVPVMAGQVVRFFPEYREGHKTVKAGRIGTPAAARMRRGGTMPDRGPNSWFMDHTRSGGVLLDLAVHEFDWLRWTLGEVKTLYSRSVGAKSMKGPDYALTTLTFDDGAVAHVESTWMDPGGFRTSFEVCGSQGMIEFDSRRTASVRSSAGGKTVNEAPLAPTDDPYFSELRSFVDSVANGTEPPVTGYDGLMAVSIAQAAIESARTGKVVSPARHF